MCFTALGAVGCDWHRRGSIFWGPIRVLLQGCWWRWQNRNCCRPGWWLLKVQLYCIIVGLGFSIWFFLKMLIFSSYPFVQEKLWLCASHNSTCWFCDQTNSTLWTVWQTCFFHLEEDRAERDWTNWWSWCVYAGLSPSLHQQPSCWEECSRIWKWENWFPSWGSYRCLRVIGKLACM